MPIYVAVPYIMTHIEDGVRRQHYQ